MQELVNSRSCRLCRGNPTIAKCRASTARLWACLVLFRKRYGDDLDDREAWLPEQAMLRAETLAALTALPSGPEASRDTGETAGGV